jgi:two-component system, chemotaxis family, protein-glutamate methylesterase/glutaminase
MENALPKHDIIVIGTSAGGVEALMNLVGELPPELPAALFVVLHIPAQSAGLLPSILSRCGPFPAVHPTNHTQIKHGCIYVAPPDHHLLLEPGHVRVVKGPKENRHRPAVDPLFRSAALAYGSRVIGVILTGSLNDGTAGLRAVKQCGGIAVVQDPKDALFPDMPESAIEYVTVDYIVPLSEVAALLSRLVYEQALEDPPNDVPVEMATEVAIAAMEKNVISEERSLGTPSVYACPQCGSTLWEIHDGNLLRFRCRVGHAYTLETMLAQQDETLEEVLWRALKTLEEQASLTQRMIEQAHQHGPEQLVPHFEEKLQQTRQRLNLLKEGLQENEECA